MALTEQLKEIALRAVDLVLSNLADRSFDVRVCDEDVVEDIRQSLAIDIATIYTKAPIAPPASAQKPIAWATTNEDGDYAMLFFDQQEARRYSGDDEPVGLAPVSASALRGTTITRSNSYESHVIWATKARINKEVTAARTALAAAEADNKRLRDALKETLECGEDGDWQSARRVLAAALDQPHDDSTLRRLLAEAKAGVYEECAKVCENSDRYRGDYFAAKIRELAEKAK